MIRRLCFGAAVGFFLMPGWVQASGQVVPEPVIYSEAFEAVWKTIDRNFYDPSFLGVNWTEIGVHYRARLASVSSDDDFTKLFDQMLRELPTSHLHFRVSAASKTMTPLTKIAVMTHKIGSENVIVNVEPTSFL